SSWRCRRSSCRRGSIVGEADGFGDENGPIVAFEFHRALRGDAHAALDLLDRFEFEVQADAGAGRDHAGEAHSIGAVIDAARAVLDPVECRSEPRYERQGQPAMRDGLAAGHLALCPLDIDMDPLVVAGGVGEFVYLVLADRVPVAGA